MRALGAGVELDGDRVRVAGRRAARADAPGGPLDCGNAGTLMRLLPGILAGQEGRFELVGDESLSTRPMERIAEPLAGDGRARRDRRTATRRSSSRAARSQPIRYELRWRAPR